MPSANEESLKSLQKYLEAIPFVNFVLLLRDTRKQISFLKGIGQEDGRLRASFLITGTVTGRMASKHSDFGPGSSLQTIDRRLRQVFVADRGKTLVNFDLTQADSWNAGARMYTLFYDTYGAEYASRYLDACESGDLHIAVARLVWTDKPWTGDLEQDRKIAAEIFHKQDSFRQSSKKLGHATNYIGNPKTLAKKTFIPRPLVEQFQKLYFEAFPTILLWQDWISSHFSDKPYPAEMTTLYGRRRTFFGRTSDAKTIRDAAAYEPQSMSGHQIDKALHAAWRKFSFIELYITSS